jgi:hypothetical protein
MKQLAIAALFLLAACASAPSGPKGEIAAPEFAIEQLVGPRDLNFPEGEVDVQFSVRIGNRSAVPMKLRRIQLRTVNPEGGAYTLVPRTYFFNATVDAGREKTITFWAHAIMYGRSPREYEPVTLRGVADFEVPGGHYTHIFNGEMNQYAE